MNNPKSRNLRREALRSVEEALKLLEASREFSYLIPEVRTNLVEAVPGARTVDDVVGVPGRITSVKGRVVAVAKPDFGGSNHLARFILALIERGAKVRAGINIRFSEEILRVVKEVCREKNLIISYFDRRKEPEEVKRVEGMSMKWAAEEALRNAGGKTPNVVYDFGGWGKEPLIRLLGENAVEVARLAVCIAKRLIRGSKANQKHNDSLD